MGKRKQPLGFSTSIIYQDELYDLTTIEYGELEDKLDYLDKLANDTETQEAGYQWIVYEYLQAQVGYDLPPPKFPKPKPIPKEWDDPIDGPTLAEKGKDILAAASRSNIDVDEAEAARRPVRNFQARQLPSGYYRDKEAKNAGGSIGLICMFIFLLGGMIGYCGNSPLAVNGKLVRRDGTVVDNDKVKYPSLDERLQEYNRIREEQALEALKRREAAPVSPKTGNSLDSPESGRRERNLPVPKNVLPDVHERGVLPDQEWEKELRKTQQDRLSRDPKILPSLKNRLVIPKRILEADQKSKEMDND